MAERLDTAVCVVPSEERAGEYAVVLAASGIDYRLVETSAGWALTVSARDTARAKDALTAYDEENRKAASAEAPPPEYGRTWIGAVAAVLLLGFFAVTGPRGEGGVWFQRGSASAQQILEGQVWRTVTALTLHADPVHVLGNAVACVILVTAVGWWLGPGVGIWLVLVAGAGGNALTALASGARHVSVGASTATFGAVGILAARQFAARRRGWWARRARWVVVAASLALLGMLGTGERADILAHLFGLLVGGALGIGAALAVRRAPGPSVQWPLGLAAAATVVASWWVALATIPPR